MTRQRLGRVLGMLFLAASTAFGASVLGLLYLAIAANPYATDFGQDYLLARTVRDGIDPYQPIRDLAAHYGMARDYLAKSDPTPHPPTMALLSLPLGLLDLESATRVWFSFELVCLLGLVVLAVRATHLPIGRRAALSAAISLAGWPPITADLRLGQLMLPIAMVLAGAYVSLLGGRSGRGGLLLGVTFWIKPVAWPWLIVLLIRRDWQAVAWAAGTTVLGYGLATLAVGPTHMADYLTRVLPGISAQFLGEPTNLSLWTIGPRLGLASLASVPPAIVLGAATWWCTARQPSIHVGLALMTLVGLLVSPITWYFYALLAFVPAAQLFASVIRGRWQPGDVAVLVAAVVLLCPGQADWLQLARAAGAPLVLLGPTGGLIALCLGLVWLSERHALWGATQDH